MVDGMNDKLKDYTPEIQDSLFKLTDKIKNGILNNDVWIIRAKRDEIEFRGKKLHGYILLDNSSMSKQVTLSLTIKTGWFSSKDIRLAIDGDEDKSQYMILYKFFDFCFNSGAFAKNKKILRKINEINKSF